MGYSVGWGGVQVGRFESYMGVGEGWGEGEFVQFAE